MAWLVVTFSFCICKQREGVPKFPGRVSPDKAKHKWGNKKSYLTKGDKLLNAVFGLLTTLNTYCKGWYWSWSSNTSATWCKELTHWKRPWCWERLKAKVKGGHRGWNHWLASLTQWTWVWANSRREWETGKPGVLQSMKSRRVRH